MLLLANSDTGIDGVLELMPVKRWSNDQYQSVSTAISTNGSTSCPCRFAYSALDTKLKWLQMYISR